MMIRFRPFYLDDYRRIAEMNNMYSGLGKLNCSDLDVISRSADVTQLCEGPAHQCLNSVAIGYCEKMPVQIKANHDVCHVLAWAQDRYEKPFVIDRYIFVEETSDEKIMARNLPTHGLRKLISAGYDMGATDIVIGISECSSMNIIRDYFESRGFVKQTTFENGVDVYHISMKKWVHKYYSMDVPHLIYLDAT